jgi:phenylalanyl-tRNA synthetase beta chain
MVALGLNETCSYTLIPKDEVHKFTTDEFKEVYLADPMSEDRNTLRYSLLYSLKEIYLYNKARNNTNISIFEVGKGFYKEDGIYKEDLKLAGLMTGDYYLDINNSKVDFYIVKGVVEELLEYLGFGGRYSFVVGGTPEELHPGQSASIILQGKPVGVIGKLHPNVLKDNVYVFEINLDKLLSNFPSRMSYKDIPKFPSISKDIAFILKMDVTAGEVMATIKKAGGKLLQSISVFDVYTGENVGDDEKSIAFKLNFMDPTRTLTDEEVMNVFNTIITKVENSHNAKLRDK